MSTHNYHWTQTATAENCYKITWFDGETSLCSTETKVVGPEDGVQINLSFAASQLRKENSHLFPEEVEEVSMESGIATLNEEEIYG